jgi:hypothetical protein
MVSNVYLAINSLVIFFIGLHAMLLIGMALDCKLTSFPEDVDHVHIIVLNICGETTRPVGLRARHTSARQSR